MFFIFLRLMSLRVVNDEVFKIFLQFCLYRILILVLVFILVFHLALDILIFLLLHFYVKKDLILLLLLNKQFWTIFSKVLLVAH
jgi:hypothetical protein